MGSILYICIWNFFLSLLKSQTPTWLVLAVEYGASFFLHLYVHGEDFFLSSLHCFIHPKKWGEITNRLLWRNEWGHQASPASLVYLIRHLAFATNTFSSPSSDTVAVWLLEVLPLQGMCQWLVGMPMKWDRSIKSGQRVEWKPSSVQLPLVLREGISTSNYVCMHTSLCVLNSCGKRQKSNVLIQRYR